MALEFRLPDIGEGVVEGEVVRWLVNEGDTLREDQPMVEVMTDKATVEIPSPRAGKVARILAPAGKTCAVGQVMVVIEEKGDLPGATGARAGAASAAVSGAHGGAASAVVSGAAHGGATGVIATSAAVLHAGPRSVTVPLATVSRKILAAPATRQLARELGVDLRGVGGTGPGGRVTKEDVRRGAGQRQTAAQTAWAQTSRAPAAYLQGALPPPAPPLSPAPAAAPQRTAAPSQRTPSGPWEDERLPFRGLRRKIAENMTRSKHQAAHFTYVEECDATELVALRARAKKRAEERGIRLSYLPFIVKAVVAGLKKFPIVNATLDAEREEIVLRKQYHVGVAAATEGGLVVPVLHDADQMSLFEMSAQLEALSEKARTGKATREELSGSTFTISSLGTLGGVLATPIINFPEVAILGVHKMKETPVVREGQIVIRTMMNLSISLDHRIVDGYQGAQFLAHVISLLEDPTLMFMEMV